MGDTRPVVSPSGSIDKNQPAHQSLARGTEVDRFIVLGLVGRGAMGEVYAAHDPELDRKIAIKLLRAGADDAEPGDAGRARLVREAQAIAKVSHPNVVVVYDVGTYEGRVFIAMEFIAGHTLGYWLESQPRTVTEILEVFSGAGRGLAAAHEKELVHRDFKPENVMVGADGQARVMDFGLVRLAMDREETLVATPRPLADLASIGANYDPLATYVIEGPVEAASNGNLKADAWNLTQAGAMIGTPAYMSPEQFRGEPADARTDQFSFCVALYEALYGERPFFGTNLLELTANVIAGRVRPEPVGARVPRRIRNALLRGMSVDPETRFPTIAALLTELRSDAALAGTRRFAEGAAVKLAGIWEAPEGERSSSAETEAKAEIRRAFLATGKAYAAPAFEATSRVLDRFARRWTDVYVDACEATHLRGEQSTEVLDLRMSALGEALRDLRALCRELRQATADTVENGVNAATALGTLERCSDVNLLRAIVRPPEDPTTLAVGRRHARPAVGDPRAGARRSRRRRHQGHRRARGRRAAGRVRAAAGRGAAGLGDDAPGCVRLRDRDPLAGRRGLDRRALPPRRGRGRGGRPAWSSRPVTRSRASTPGRSGAATPRPCWRASAATRSIRGWLFNNRGAMRATQGRLRDAVEDVHRAIAAKEKALGPNDPDVGISLVNVAIYLDELGETVRAAAYHRTRRAYHAGDPRARSPEGRHPARPTTPSCSTASAATARRWSRPGTRWSCWSARPTPTGCYVTYPLVALGASHVGLGQYREALPSLERAARIRERQGEQPASHRRGALRAGRALWGAGQDRPRALALVERARAEFRATPPTPATQRELADIELWLASRAEPPSQRPATATVAR